MPARRDPRSVLRTRLERIQADLDEMERHGADTNTLTSQIEADWPYEHTTRARMDQAYGLDRLALLDAGESVGVYGWEIGLPADHERYTI